MKNRILQLYDYHKWANDRTFKHLTELPADVYDREIESVFSSVEEVIVHIYQTDGMWLSVMSGDTFEETMSIIEEQKTKSADQDIEGMQNLYAEVAQQYDTFLTDQDDLERIMTIKHPRYGKVNRAISEMVNHVVNHGTYHRGNITAMLRQQGHAGVPTDFIFYLYEGGGTG